MSLAVGQLRIEVLISTEHATGNCVNFRIRGLKLQIFSSNRRERETITRTIETRYDTTQTRQNDVLTISVLALEMTFAS